MIAWYWIPIASLLSLLAGMPLGVAVWAFLLVHAGDDTDLEANTVFLFEDTP